MFVVVMVEDRAEDKWGKGGEVGRDEWGGVLFEGGGGGSEEGEER